MKKTIIAIIILVATIGLYFWARWEVKREIYLERMQEDLKALENEKHNLRIDNESMERELKIYEDCPTGDCKG